jgi:TolB-like protein/DNA-binding winged helix-turn-helix (wHTH) protein/Flp pilus assembly protein TadD
MEHAPCQSRVLKFGVFEVDLEAGELRKSGMRQKLAGQPFRVLQLLLERPQEIVTREELQQRIWPKDTVVDYDLALKKAVNRVREVLGDSAESPHFIETIPRKGYRFIAPVSGNGAAHSVAKAPTTEATTETPQSSRNLYFRIVLALGTAALLLGVIAARSWWRRSGTSAAPQIRSLAVLPMENLSADPAQEYFSDGMTDALITDLAQISSLKVISRTSSMQYKQTKKSLPEISHELNVDGIIEGTVQRSGDHVRITAQLIHGPSDKHLWAESYERDLRDVLALENDVARAISQEIQIKLSPEQSALQSKLRPIDPDAYLLYLKGRYLWNNRDPQALKTAIAYFQQAVEKDPNQPLLYSGLASGYVLLGQYDVLQPKEVFPRARSAATKALQLDETLAEAHNALAAVDDYEWDWPGAEREFRRAIELNPGDATSHQWYAELSSEVLGQHEEAIAEIKKAQSLDLLSPIINTIAGRILLFAGRRDEAIQQLRSTLEMNPNFAPVHFVLGNAYLQEGLTQEAVQEFQAATALSPSRTRYTGALACAYGRAGRSSEARKLLNRLIVLSKSGYVSSVDIAWVYAGLGEKDEAFASLEKAYDEHDPKLRWLKTEPIFEGLRSDPRFQNLIRRVGLPQ